MADDRTYIKVHDGITDHPKIDPLSDAAFRLLIDGWGWCSRHLTDGVMPRATWLKRGTAKSRAELVAAGLVVEADALVEWHDYLDHQQSAEQRRAAKEQRRAAGRAGGLARAKQRASGSSSESLSDSSSKSTAEVEVEVNKEKKDAAAPLSAVADEPRSDVEGLCSYFLAALARNDVRATVTQKWRTEARLLLDKDAKAPAEIRAVIDWATNNDFWRANILSVPKLREKYDQLRLQMTAGRPRLVEGDNREYLREWQ